MLTDDDFTFGGVTWTIERLFNINNIDMIALYFERDARTGLDALHYCVSSTALAFSDAQHTTNAQQDATWSHGPDWCPGDQMALKIGYRTSCAATQTTPQTPRPAHGLAVGDEPGDGGLAPVTMTATLSSALTSDVSIPVTVTAGTTESGDYGTLTDIRIKSGLLSGTGSITTAEDTDKEYDETLTAALGTLPSSVAVMIGKDSGEDATPLTVYLVATPNKVPKGGAVTVKAVLSEKVKSDLSIPVERGHGGER